LYSSQILNLVSSALSQKSITESPANKSLDFQLERLTAFAHLLKTHQTLSPQITICIQHSAFSWRNFTHFLSHLQAHFHFHLDSDFHSDSHSHHYAA